MEVVVGVGYFGDFESWWFSCWWVFDAEVDGGVVDYCEGYGDVGASY